MKKFFAMLGALFAFSLSVFAGNVSTRPIPREDGLTSTIKPQAKIINGHKFIDLGLPSGLLWAETNVGASSATDEGDYFAWGETKPKTMYTWGTYKWGSEWNNSIKYNASDGKKTLDAADDAATVNWGTPCRMPDFLDFQELYDRCDWVWKSNYNGTSGYLVTGPNGNTIFFPASGSRAYDELYGCGSYGDYWSRSLGPYYTADAHFLAFLNGDIAPADYFHRFDGYTVRPVAEKSSTLAYTIINGHKFIDLGLPSGLLWAEANVGASSATKDGGYFAWGETELKTKTTYDWDTYKWGNNTSKYNSSDGKTTLDAEDDAATVNWGAPCRMPDYSDFEELYNKCIWFWKSNYNGASGYLVTGPNGNVIFFPSSGNCRGNDDIYGHGSNGNYWSRSLYSSYSDLVYNFHFDSGSLTLAEYCRDAGFSVRPVAEKNKVRLVSAHRFNVLNQ